MIDIVFATWEETHNVSVSMVHFKISGMLVTELLSVAIYLYKTSNQKKMSS